MGFWVDKDNKPISDAEYHGRRDLIGSTMINDFIKDPNTYFMKYCWKNADGTLGHHAFHSFNCEDKKQLARKIIFDFGGAVHAMLLTPTRSAGLVIKRPANSRIAPYYENNPGCFIIPESNASGEDFDMLMSCVQEAKENPFIAKLIANEDQNEIAYTMKDPFTGALTYKVKFDITGEYKTGGRFFGDLKTTKATSVNSFISKYLASGYDVQGALYATAHKDAYGEYPVPSPKNKKEGSGILYSCVPKVKKYGKSYVFELPKRILEIGLKKLEKASIRLAECYDKGFDHMYSTIILPDIEDFRPTATELE